jgi:hypothetical protein
MKTLYYTHNYFKNLITTQVSLPNSDLGRKLLKKSCAFGRFYDYNFYLPSEVPSDRLRNVKMKF